MRNIALRTKLSKLPSLLAPQVPQKWCKLQSQRLAAAFGPAAQPTLSRLSAASMLGLILAPAGPALHPSHPPAAAPAAMLLRSGPGSTRKGVGKLLAWQQQLDPALMALPARVVHKT